MSTACVLIIGNEILSGRTQDINLNWLAKELNEAGVRLREARVVRDEPEAIIAAVNACRKAYTYVFTTGGIGPTHDDITSECIARAFGVRYTRHPEAEALLRKHYDSGKLNAARLKMSDMPEGATLIPNPISTAPGFIIGNVYVMAGIPGIMRSMFAHVKPMLKGEKPERSETVSVFLPEGTIAKGLTEVQSRFPGVEIGSYPFVKDNRYGTSLVARSDNAAQLASVRGELLEIVKRFDGELTQEA